MSNPPFFLKGLDGSNPLGFLAGLGTLVSLGESGAHQPRLGWTWQGRWTPFLEGVNAQNEDHLASQLAEVLKGQNVAPDAEKRRAEAQREMDRVKTEIKRKLDDIKKRRLRGAERSEAIERELRPLEREYEEKRRVWLEALQKAVPRPELALGKKIDCTPEEFRGHAASLAAGSRLGSRSALDLLAAFGSDAVFDRKERAIEPTPFCFISGSGHQYFLETARELMSRVTPEAVRRVVFEPWDYTDEGLSMRWDPLEDRRYALMDRDPSSGNKPRTVWMANLLAYRALALFPSVPVGLKLGTPGWDRKGSHFTWPIWEPPLTLDTVRSLLNMRELAEDQPPRQALRARGIVALFRAQRISVGSGSQKKLNFSPARQI